MTQQTSLAQRLQVLLGWLWIFLAILGFGGFLLTVWIYGYRESIAMGLEFYRSLVVMLPPGGEYLLLVLLYFLRVFFLIPLTFLLFITGLQLPLSIAYPLASLSTAAALSLAYLIIQQYEQSLSLHTWLPERMQRFSGILSKKPFFSTFLLFIIPLFPPDLVFFTGALFAVPLSTLVATFLLSTPVTLLPYLTLGSSVGQETDLFLSIVFVMSVVIFTLILWRHPSLQGFFSPKKTPRQKKP